MCGGSHYGSAVGTCDVYSAGRVGVSAFHVGAKGGKDKLMAGLAAALASRSCTVWVPGLSGFGQFRCKKATGDSAVRAEPDAWEQQWVRQTERTAVELHRVESWPASSGSSGCAVTGEVCWALVG